PAPDPEGRMVLVMGRPPDLVEPLVEGLHHKGWSVVSCAGPSTERCPLIEGLGVCDRRRVADATIAFVHDAGGPPSPDLALRLRCAGDGHAPVLLALEGKVDPPRIAGITGTVGALRGPNSLVEGCERILKDDATPNT
ncbi:MAG TPA: hypothetical protein VFS18_05525, partial [Actinomycetota bacterium]|nr:hypothetical protein [Actinomycetota bacterium]